MRIRIYKNCIPKLTQTSSFYIKKWINFIRAGRFIREFPFTLWMITMLPIAIYIYFLFKNKFNIIALYHNFIDGNNFIKINNVRFDITMKIVLLLTFNCNGFEDAVDHDFVEEL